MKRFQFGALVALSSLPLFALGCGSSNPTTTRLMPSLAELVLGVALVGNAAAHGELPPAPGCGDGADEDVGVEA